MELEIDFSIENILFVLLFIYCIYLLFFSFSYPKKEGLSTSLDKDKKSKSKKTDDSEDKNDDSNNDNNDNNDNSNDDSNNDSNDDTTYKTTAPSNRKKDKTDGIGANSTGFIKHLKHDKEDTLYKLNIPKYKDNYKKIIDKIDDATDLYKLSFALQSGYLFPGTTTDDLSNTLDKYS
jgi:FtsZ-interacting cell division protein ZipA